MSAIEGGCACGAVRFRINGPLMGMGVCHCRACQHSTGGGPNYVAIAPKGSLEVTKGTARTYHSKADSGADIGRAFCADCGSPLWSEPGADLPIMAVKAGALDDPSGLTPSMHIYTEAAQPWHLMHEGLPAFPRSPG